MSTPQLIRISALLENHEESILSEWMRAQLGHGVFGGVRPKESDLREQSKALFRSLREAMQKANSIDITTPEWELVREHLAAASQSNALDGASPTETATSVLSLKQPIFIRLAAEFGSNSKELSDQIWNLTALLDKLALYTAEVHQKSREKVIARQQQEMMELSTPVVELWRGILALPLIGTLDSQRTQVVMENLLQKIADTGAPIAIIDITGVPTVDTL